jgi:crotonyl-CoA carboxylase/reductase
MNELALNGQLNPCTSRAFPYDELPVAHQLMNDNQHPHGNMAVLIGAPDFGLGKSAAAAQPMAKPRLPKGDVHDTPHPYPLSAPLPDVAAAEEIKIHDDGTKVRERMHPGIISCRKSDSLREAGRKMIEHDIHALVVVEGGKVEGVLSQTDIVLARQGRTADEAMSQTVDKWMTPGCATCDVDAPLSSAISQMMRLRIHRLVVTENGKPLGVLSMTDIVRRSIET